MPTLLPRDGDNTPIPALRLKPGSAHSIAVTSSSARNATGFDTATRVVSLYSTVDVFVKFGGGSVTAAATDHFIPADLYYDVAIGGERTGHYTHIAAIRAGEENGTLYISEKE